MNVLLQLVKRNMRLYFRDKASVFFSFLSVIIIILMYFLFLGDMQIDNLKNEMPNIDGIEWLVNSWIMAGILTVSTITVPLGILGTLIKDRHEGLLNDFYTSPINRNVLALGYLVSAWVVSFMMVLFNFIIGQLYVVANGGELLGIVDTLSIILLSAGSIMVFSSAFFFIAIFMESQNAFGLLSTLVGTFVGFLGGIYIPIGVLSENVQTVMNVLPTAHAVTLMRQIYMKDAIETVFGSPTIPFYDQYAEIYGLVVNVGGTQVSTPTMILSMVVFGLIFYAASVIALTYRKL